MKKSSFSETKGVSTLQEADTVKLLAVVEVPKSKKIKCQNEGCGHSVYKRVHVIEKNGVIGVFGSECAKKIFGTNIQGTTPSHTGDHTATLNELDVELLLRNTQELLEKLKAIYNPELKSAVTVQTSNSSNDKNASYGKENSKFGHMSDSLLMRYCRDKARESFRQERGLDPDAPGWVGLVESDAKKLFKKFR